MPNSNRAGNVIDTILGEAVWGTPAERYADMLGIASVIDNRAKLGNVTPENVIAAPGQFDAYGKALPEGAVNFRDMANRAWNQVQTIGPVTNATYYSTPSAVGNLPSGLQPVAQTAGHVYQVDPQARSFATTKGYVKPSLGAIAAVAGTVARATEALAVGAANVLGGTVNAAENITNAALGVGVPGAEPRGAVRGPGLAALAPNGLIGAGQTYGPEAPENEIGRAIRSNLADVSYSMGPNRPNAPSQETVDIARSAVRDVMGPGYSVDVISGMENPGVQYGSNRHRTGLAADVQIRDPMGNIVNSFDNPQAMLDVAQAMAAKGAIGIGIGTNYMGAKGIHVDQVTPGPGQANTWGNIGAANRGLLTDSMISREMPASFYDRELPGQMEAPQTRDSALADMSTQARDTAARQEAAQSMAQAGIAGLDGRTGYTAPVDQIDRSALGPTTAPAQAPASAPSPARPDNFAAAGPKGSFSVTPGTPSALGAPAAPSAPSAPSAAALGLATGPTAAAAPSAPASAPASAPSAPASAPTSAAAKAAAYGQLASTMQAAGVTSLAGTAPAVTPEQVATAQWGPAPPSTPAAQVAAPRTTTIAQPAVRSVTAPAAQARRAQTIAQSFPAAPAAFGKPAQQPKSKVSQQVAGAVLGGLLGGPLGAVAGGLLGSTNKNPFSALGGLFGATPNPGSYSVGSGVKAIDSILGGGVGAGATAYSNSNPDVSYRDLGNGIIEKTNSKFGTVEYSKAAQPGGSLFGGGGLFGGRGGLFGGGGGGFGGFGSGRDASASEADRGGGGVSSGGRGLW